MTANNLAALYLITVAPTDRERIMFPFSAPLVIGHSASADIVIDDPFVSGEHALVTVDGSGQVTIRDLNSTIGTFVNGERITGARVLRDGDGADGRSGDAIRDCGAETDGTASAAVRCVRRPPCRRGRAGPWGTRRQGARFRDATGDTAYTVSGTVVEPGTARDRRAGRSARRQERRRRPGAGYHAERQ